MKKPPAIVFLIVCAGLFFFGLYELVKLRFDQGDIYPYYSSLRADPLGTMAFYESLEKIPGLKVSRDFSDSNRFPDGKKIAYLHLASPAQGWQSLEKDEYEDTLDFLSRGNRLVITFAPEFDGTEDKNISTNSIKANKTKKAKIKSDKAAKPKKKNKKSVLDDEVRISLAEKWGIEQGFKALDKQDDVYVPVEVFNKSDLPLPPQLNWHGGMIFKNCTNAWHVIYSRGTNPVVVERFFGKGSVVMATDSYFVSNEAMEDDRHADLLAWLVGTNGVATFDEAHLGIVETSGIAVLMRKYRLHGFFAGMLVVAVLFIWKNSTSLAPARAEEVREDFVEGKDSASGFVNLLRRSITPRELLNTCFEEWKKSAASAKNLSSSRTQSAEAVFTAENSLPARERNAIDAYRKISSALGTRKKLL